MDQIYILQAKESPVSGYTFTNKDVAIMDTLVPMVQCFGAIREEAAFDPNPMRYDDDIGFLTLGECLEEDGYSALNIMNCLAMIRRPGIVMFRHVVVKL